ncbi:MAG: hypothetical protein L0Z70_07330, partial [Chloroflexi bacterium]|nr:hypothetical protein [Chloroflexota bacterium]
LKSYRERLPAELLGYMNAEIDRLAALATQVPVIDGKEDVVQLAALRKAIDTFTSHYTSLQQRVQEIVNALKKSKLSAASIQKMLEDLQGYLKSLPPELQTALNGKIDPLIAKAKEAGEDLARLEELRKELDAFAKAYIGVDLNSIFDAVLHSHIPVDEESVVASLRRGSAMLTTENPQLKATLDDIVQQAEIFTKQGETRIATARLAAEKWFNDVMDRAGGWYKREMQRIGLVIGFSLAFAFNVDALAIARQLWVQPALREGVVAAAENYQYPTDISDEKSVAEVKETIANLNKSLTNLGLPLGWKVSSAPYQPDKGCPVWDETVVSTYRGLRLRNTCITLLDSPVGWTGWLLKLLGVFITGAATMQGAPFWFDMLKKIINVRSTGVKPEEKNQGKK